MVDLKPFHAGIEAARSRIDSVCVDPRQAFIDTLTSYGLKIDGPLRLGHLERVDGPEDRPGRKSAWYVYHEFPSTISESNHGSGSFGDWKSDLRVSSWTSSDINKMSTQERIALHTAREEQKKAYEAEKSRRYIEAAEQSYNLWNMSPDAPVDHPYLARKQVIPAPGVKIGADGRLIVPISIEGQITSLEYILPDGAKRRMTGGKVQGGYFIINGQGPTVYICEGYSTGMSIHMATGSTVYIAFNCGNLYEVCGHVASIAQDKICVIAADDDVDTSGNPGKTKAEQAGRAFHMSVVTPPGFNDFNDLHVELGLDALRAFFAGDSAEKEEKKKKEEEDPQKHIRLPGILSDIYSYYNATSGFDQFGLAEQTALAICSVVLARAYQTDNDNFSSLFFLATAKSGMGKEHVKKTVERILAAANMEHLIGGDGYTSDSAVLSQTLDKPRHITVTDEMGKYLQASKKQDNSLHHKANAKLMEAFGRCDGVLRPLSYSTMTLKKDQADHLKNRKVYNPGITLVGITTPDTFFDAIDITAVKDGFINRFIIHLSDIKRVRRKRTPYIDVPQKIIDWIHTVTERHGKQHVASDIAEPIILTISEEAWDIHAEFDQWCVDQAVALEAQNMEELANRGAEIALRVSLIAALANNPMATYIDRDSMRFAVEYIRKSMLGMFKAMALNLSSSDHEAQRKMILEAIRATGEGGVSKRQMLRVSPYKALPEDRLDRLLSELTNAELIIYETKKSSKGGRPTQIYRAII